MKKKLSGFDLVGKSVSYKQGRGFATGEVLRSNEDGSKIVIARKNGGETSRDVTAVTLAS